MARFKRFGHDIVLGGPDAPPLAASAENTNYLFVQLSGDRDTPDEYGLLRTKNCFPLVRVGDHLYLCRYDPADLSLLRQLDFVTLVDIYHPFLKIDNEPGLKIGRDRTALDDTLPSDGFAVGSSPQRRVKVVIGLHWDLRSPAHIQDLVSKLIDGGFMDQSEARYYASNPMEESLPYNSVPTYITTTVSIDQLSAIAAYDAVYQIARAIDMGPCDEEQRNICVDSIYNNTFSTLENNTPYTGKDQRIHFHDTGFDDGNRQNPHPAFQSDRIVALYNVMVVPQYRGPVSDLRNHGTAVIGVAVGNDSSVQMPGGAPPHGRSEKVRGIAPGASFVSTSVYGQSGGYYPGEFKDYLHAAYWSHGARVSNHSWGRCSEAGVLSYSPQVESIDNFLFHHDDLLAVFSAGNYGRQGTPRTLSGPANCKNNLVVGMSFSTNGDISTIHPASSCGPTEEGRWKPDMCAPGTSVLAPSSRGALPRFQPPGGGLYTRKMGTSFSAPVVSGCAALIREALRNEHRIFNPSAALMKALLINGCAKMRKVASDHMQLDLPNAASGFGRVNVGGSMKSVVPRQNLILNHFVDKPMTFRLGQRYTIPFTIPSPPTIYPGGPTADQTFKVTLVWTDKADRDLQFGLGLVVISSTGTSTRRRYGNSGWDDRPDDDQFFDTVNNVQQVIWRRVPPGPLAVEVVCLKLATDHDEFNKWALAWSFE